MNTIIKAYFEPLASIGGNDEQYHLTGEYLISASRGNKLIVQLEAKGLDNARNALKNALKKEGIVSCTIVDVNDYHELLETLKIRPSVQYLTRQHIVSKEDVQDFIWALVNKQRLNFHPDTNFCEYVNKKNMPIYNYKECAELDTTLKECLTVCKQEGVDIYAFTLEVLQKNKY